MKLLPLPLAVLVATLTAALLWLADRLPIGPRGYIDGSIRCDCGEPTAPLLKG